MEKKNKVFLSYVREDAKDASRLYHALKLGGVDVWMDQFDLAPGQDWKLAIAHAIRESSFFLALISSNSVNKRGYVQKEIREAISVMEEMPPSEIFIIPIRLDDCQPSHDFLQSLNWVDLFPVWGDGVERLVNFLSPSDSTQLDIFEILSNPELIIERFRSIQFVKSIAFRFRDRHSIGYFLKNCVRLIPNELQSKNIHAKNLSNCSEDLAACLELYYIHGCGDLDEKTACSSCGKTGTIIHGYMDIGGKTPADYNDNYVSWCTNCLWAWYFFESPYPAGPVQEFNYITNTYEEKSA